MVHSIYCIENILNGKVYVGRTQYDIRLRWNAHVQSPSRKTALGRDVLEFGAAIFTIRLLDTAANSLEAAKRERLYTHLLESNDPQFGYNSPKIYRWSLIGKSSRWNY